MEPRPDPRLEAAIRAVDAWRGRDTGVTEVSVGRDERHMLIEVDEELFVLRLAAPTHEGPGLDATDEVEVARAAASAGVAPEVIAALPQLGCLVTRFAPGRRLAPRDVERDDVLDSLVGSVRALHACPPPTGERSIFREARDLRRTAVALGLPLPASEPAATQALDRIEAAATSEVRAIVTCHGDLTTSSVLLDGEHVWLVDYRWAGAGDPYEDLGSLAARLELPDERCDALLARYFGTVTADHRLRLGLMRTASDYLAAMRALLGPAEHRTDADDLLARVAGASGVRPR